MMQLAVSAGSIKQLLNVLGLDAEDDQPSDSKDEEPNSETGTEIIDEDPEGDQTNQNTDTHYNLHTTSHNDYHHKHIDTVDCNSAKISTKTKNEKN